MEVMEEGNLMDRVPILLQRDLQYYQKNQTVLQENICVGVVGGRLDFPRSASFASVKLVMWWEEEFVAAFRTASGLIRNNDEDGAAAGGGVVKTSDPDKFVNLVVKSSEQLLEHLDVLSQEALDHADLPVLTATLGASALVKNSLHCYIQASQHVGSSDQAGSLQVTQKTYGEMAEALAERLLDLHIRLLSLYILQGSHGEGGSSSIRMWWLYMQGTKIDLWNTVPPKVAQRVFAGMLNETLTILTVRYTQELPEDSKNNSMVNDILNILLCVTQLLPSICAKGEELIGLNLSSLGKIIRDVHAKCHELLVCLLLRGAPLHSLYKIFKQNTGVTLFESRPGYPSLWYILCMPHLFPPNSADAMALSCADLTSSTAISLELLVLLGQPQPLWSLLLKVVLMRDCKVAKGLLKYTLQNLKTTEGNSACKTNDKSTCGGFLCVKDGSCMPDKKVAFDKATVQLANEPSEKTCASIVYALTHIIVTVCSKADIRLTLIQGLESIGISWSSCLDRRQLWVLKHPPWLSAILDLIRPILPSIAETLINALQTGASMYQTMSLCLTCFSQMWDCLPKSLLTVSNLLTEVLPATSTPVGGSVLLQFLIMALYEELINISETYEAKEAALQNAVETKKENKKNSSKKEKKSSTKKEKDKNKQINEKKLKISFSVSFDGSLTTISSTAMALAEALCSIDEDSKHTDQIEQFLKQTNETLKNEEDFSLEGIIELMANSYPSNPVIECIEYSEGAEIMVSQLLMTHSGKTSLQTLYNYLLKYPDWLLKYLNTGDHLPFEGNKHILIDTVSLLYTMFYIGRHPFDLFLSGSWDFDWNSLLTTPLSLTPERVWAQVSRRPEFQNNANLSLPDAAMVATIMKHIKDLI